MPGISVIDADGEIQEFAEATTWHIDDRGQLHLKAGENQVASFAKDRWQGAGTSEAASLSLSAQAAALAAHTEQLAEIHELLREILGHVKHLTAFDMESFEALLHKRGKSAAALAKAVRS